MSNRSASLPAAQNASARKGNSLAARYGATDTRRQKCQQPPRHKNFLEEPMLHDLYLMSANPSVEADARRKFEHRALTFTEMAASCKHHETNTSAGKNNAIRKNLFLAILEGGVRA
jgi:hypothetical protein